jgi:hypothetical protein
MTADAPPPEPAPEPERRPEPEPRVRPAPGPVPRRNRTTRRLLIIALVVLVVCCGGGAVTGWALYHWYDAGAGPAVVAANAFLSDLERDDTPKAYTRLCPDVTAHLTQDAFTGQEHERPRLRSHKITHASIATVNGVPTSLVIAQLTRDGGVQETRTVRVVKEGGNWLVCGTPY